MAAVRKGESVYVLLRLSEEEDEGVEVHGVWSSEDAVNAYLDRLEDQGIETDDFYVIDRGMDIDPDEEE